LTSHAGGATSAYERFAECRVAPGHLGRQIQKRVRELGRQISDDYRGQTVVALGILENSFLFMAIWCGSGRCPGHVRLYQADLQAEQAGRISTCLRFS